MSLVTHGFDLPIMPGSISPVLRLSQYDDARTFTAHLKDENGNAFTLPSGATAKLEGKNCKGNTFDLDCTVDGSDITFTPKEAATDQPGLIASTLHIKNGSENISTLAVILYVQRAGATKEDVARDPGFMDALRDAVYTWLDEHKADEFDYEDKSVSGNPLSFNDGAGQNVKSLIVEMQTEWSGEGDPSPTNVRPISGGTGIEIITKDKSTTPVGIVYDASWVDKWSDNGIIQSKSWLTEGELNVLTGELTVRAILDVFDTYSESGSVKYISSTLFQYSSAAGAPAIIGDYTRVGMQRRSNVDTSNYYLTSNKAEFGTPMCNLLKHNFSNADESASWYLNSGSLTVKFPTSLIGSTAASVVEYLRSIKDTTPLMIRIPLIEPEVYQLTPQEVQTLVGANYITSNLGTMEMTYTARVEKKQDQLVSPTVDVEPIEGGNRVTITDVDGDHTFDVMDGKDTEIDTEKLDGLFGYTPINFTAAAGWRGNAIYSTNSHYHVDIPVQEGEKFHIKTRTDSTSMYAAGYFPNSNFNSITKALDGAATGFVEGYITVPSGAAYLTVNCAKAYSVVIEKYGLKADAETDLPSYFADEVDAVVETAKGHCTEKSLVFAVVTDSHLNAAYGYQVWNDTIKNIAAVNAKYPLDGIVHMGDIINGDAESSVGLEQLDKARGDFLGIGKNAVFLEGNHDLNSFYNSNADPINEAAMFSEVFRFNNTEIVRPDGKLYGYRDYDALGIRVVYLHSSMGDGTHGGRGDNWGYPSDELTWVQNVALDTEYQVLFISHMPMTQGYISDASTIPTNGNALKAIVDGFVDNGGVVVGLLHGHTHWDDIFDNGKFKEVSVGCEDYTYTPNDVVGTNIHSYTPATAVKPARMRYTVTQDLWNVVIVRPVSRTVKLVRFGSGVDRAFSY